ncbi:MAG: hypothetical protein ACQSGP_20960, partial [Frankia sp.]
PGRPPVAESAAARARRRVEMRADRARRVARGRAAIPAAMAATDPDAHRDRVAACVLGPAYRPPPETAWRPGPRPRDAAAAGWTAPRPRPAGEPTRDPVRP